MLDQLKREKKDLEDRIAHVKWRLQHCENPTTKEKLEKKLKEYEEWLEGVNADIERYE